MDEEDKNELSEMAWGIAIYGLGLCATIGSLAFIAAALQFFFPIG